MCCRHLCAGQLPVKNLNYFFRHASLSESMPLSAGLCKTDFWLT